MTDLDKKKMKKIKKQMNRTEEQNEMIKFVTILIIVVAIVVSVYFITRIFVTKDLFDKNEETKEVSFDYNTTILGALLNRPYDAYYVMVFNSKDLQANYYMNIVSRYQNEEKALKIYIADLNDSMNASFYSKDSTNPDATKVSDLKVGDLTLIKVENQKIVKYIESIENIKKELGL